MPPRTLPAVIRKVVVLVAVVVSLAGCGSSSGSSAPSSSSATTTAHYPSATADPARLLAEGDGAADVTPYAAALDELGPQCTQDRVHIAGIADAGLSDLQQHGITDETRLTVLQHLVASVRSSAKVDCQGVMAAYLVLRESK